MSLHRNLSSLHASTADPGAASTEPVPRPRPGSHPLLWYQDTKPRFYRPYLVRVLERDDTSMEFVFLDGRTGADLALSRRSYEIAYHDGRYAHSALPSTAPKAQPGSPRSCGLLFISDLYIQSLPRADADALLVSGNDDDKWPRSAGKHSPPSTRPEAKPKRDRSAPALAARGRTERARARRPEGQKQPKRRVQRARGRAAG